ncbi:MAG TPA: ABC transporter permease [Dermatophilaceae bacterium]|nr:ABC transporter permease [Dermatophilaceae bacterium]
MLSYLVRRVIGAIFLLLVITAVTFAIFFLVPRLGGASGDDLASRYVGKSAGAEQIRDTAEKLGLNDALIVQYGRFVKGIVAGADYQYGPEVERCPAPCLGYSFINQTPVFPELLSRIPVTLSLALGAAVIWLLAGVSVGVLSAVKRGSVFERVAMMTALAGVSLPIYFTGLLSLSIFSYTLGWTPAGGNASDPTAATSPLDFVHRMLLPWITLAFLYAAIYARMTRAGMLETMNEDYIRTARAKGLPERTVIVKHGVRSVLTPILTIFGLDLGLLLGGAILTESTFGLPGIGKYAVDAIVTQDLPKILGVTLLAATFIILANLVVDLLYAVIDPRVRLA